MKILRWVAVVGLVVCLVGMFAGCDVVRAMKSASHTTAKAPVVKVYTMTDGGHVFTAYVVNHGGTEVVVSDALSRSSHKVGDTIEYMVQKMELKPGQKTLSFTLLK